MILVANAQKDINARVAVSVWSYDLTTYLNLWYNMTATHQSNIKFKLRFHKLCAIQFEISTFSRILSLRAQSDSSSFTCT